MAPNPSEHERYFRCVCGAPDHYTHLGFSIAKDWPWCTVSVGVWAGGWRDRVTAAWRVLTGHYAPLAWVEFDRETAFQLAADLTRYAEAVDDGA